MCLRNSFEKKQRVFCFSEKLPSLFKLSLPPGKFYFILQVLVN